MTIKSFYRAFRKASKSFTNWNVDKNGCLWAEKKDGIHTIDVCPINAVYNTRFNGNNGLLGTQKTGRTIGLSYDDISLIMHSSDGKYEDLNHRQRQVKDALMRAVKS